MSVHMNWLRIRGTTSPFSYRVYGPPMVSGGIGGTCTISAHTIYVVPWLTGQGGQIDAFHSRAQTAHGAATGHWGIYAAQHARFIVPGGLLAANSGLLSSALHSMAATYSADPNAMHYLAFASDDSFTMYCYLFTSQPYPILGVASDGFRVHWGLCVSYDVTNGLPTTFPGSGYEFCTTSLPAPFVGVHYA